jgi:hypothetical protein
MPVTHANRKRHTYYLHAGKSSEVRLSDLIKKFCPNIGQDSFFELM